MLLQALSGAAMAANFVLCLWVASRILRRSDVGAGHPERWLAIHLIAYFCLSGTFHTLLYMGWADPEIALPEAWTPFVHAVHFPMAGLGSYALYRFTQETFFAADPRARRVVTAVALAMVVATIGVGVTERFELRVVNGGWYWLFFACKTAPFAWLAWASLRYWRQLRRRLALGLAEPLLVNRFLVWGLWSLMGFLLGFSDPVPRLIYVAMGGSPEVWNPALGMVIINWTIPVVFVPQVGMLIALFLTFFPTARYSRWVDARAQRESAATPSGR